MASSANRYERVIDRTIATWKRREPYMVDHLRGGSEPPFMQKITPAKLRQLLDLAVAGNAAAEQTVMEVLRNSYQMAQDMSGKTPPADSDAAPLPEPAPTALPMPGAMPPGMAPGPMPMAAPMGMPAPMPVAGPAPMPGAMPGQVDPPMGAV